VAYSAAASGDSEALVVAGGVEEEAAGVAEQVVAVRPKRAHLSLVVDPTS
jgi:hypothetical protein